MAVQHYSFALLVVLFLQIPTYQSINCPQSSDCVCIKNEPCILNCIGTDHCKGNVHLTCKSEQPCTINCNGPTACQDATISANGATDVTLTCTGGGDVCYGSNTAFNCGKGQCSVHCDPNSSNSCGDMNINVNAASSFQCTGNCPSNMPASYTASPSQSPNDNPAQLTSSTTKQPTSNPSLTPSKSPSNVPPTISTTSATKSTSTTTTSTHGASTIRTISSSTSTKISSTFAAIITENLSTVITPIHQQTAVELVLNKASDTHNGSSSSWIFGVIIAILVIVVIGVVYFIYQRPKSEKHSADMITIGNLMKTGESEHIRSYATSNIIVINTPESETIKLQEIHDIVANEFETKRGSKSAEIPQIEGDLTEYI